MNKWKLIFLISTGLFSLMMLGSATMYFISVEVAQTFAGLGFPDYFRIELGIAKYLGVAALLVPKIPNNVREWAYAGFGITVISAAIAHAAIGDPIGSILPPIFALALLCLSYFSRLNKK